MPPDRRRLVWTAIAITNLPILAAIAVLAPPAGTLAVIAAAVAAWIYSAPPLRTKERPFLDSLTSASHFVLPAIAGFLVAGPRAGRPAVDDPGRVLRLGRREPRDRGDPGHRLRSSRRDRLDRDRDRGPPDGRSSRSSATALAVVAALSLGLPYGPVAAAVLALFLLLPAAVLCSPTEAQARRAWRSFLGLNPIAGFVLTLLLLRHWGLSTDPVGAIWTGATVGASALVLRATWPSPSSWSGAPAAPAGGPGRRRRPRRPAAGADGGRPRPRRGRPACPALLAVPRRPGPPRPRDPRRRRRVVRRERRAGGAASWRGSARGHGQPAATASSPCPRSRPAGPARAGPATGPSPPRARRTSSSSTPTRSCAPTRFAPSPPSSCAPARPSSAASPPTRCRPGASGPSSRSSRRRSSASSRSGSSGGPAGRPRALAFAYGPLLLVDRAAYLRAGGHAARPRQRARGRRAGADVRRRPASGSASCAPRTSPTTRHYPDGTGALRAWRRVFVAYGGGNLAVASPASPGRWSPGSCRSSSPSSGPSRAIQW